MHLAYGEICDVFLVYCYSYELHQVVTCHFCLWLKAIFRAVVCMGPILTAVVCI